MQRLRGSFSATPIEKATGLRPFLNLHIARKQAKLHRLVRKGLTPPGDKASLRAAAQQAVAEHNKRVR